jgi:hypothetical protein
LLAWLREDARHQLIDGLVDALMAGVLEGVGHVGRVLAVRLRNLCQRLAGQLLAELISGDADRLGSHIQPLANEPASGEAVPARTAESTRTA